MAVTGVGGIRRIPWVVGLEEKLLMEEEDGGAIVAAATPFNVMLMMEGGAGPGPWSPNVALSVCV